MFQIAEKRVHHPDVDVIRVNVGKIINYASVQTLQVCNNNFYGVSWNCSRRSPFTFEDNISETVNVRLQNCLLGHSSQCLSSKQDLSMDAAKLAKIQSFEGLISAPFTAFKPNGELNGDIYPQYVDHLVSQGVTGVFVNGTTGEGLSLTVEERKAVAEGWVKAAKNKIELVIIQVGANSVKDAQELARHAEKIGVSGIASVPPFFYKYQTHDHLIAYFKKLAEAAPSLPLMLYHIPSYSGVEIQLADFMPKARKAIPTFCGAKFTSTEVRDLLNCHRLPGEPFKLLSGFDEVLLPCLSSGVTAAVGASYNFMAPVSLRILDAVKRGDLKRAREIQNQVLEAVLTIARHGQGISCFKAAMNLLGPLDVGQPRVPLVPLSSEALKNLGEDLKKLRAVEWSKV